MEIETQSHIKSYFFSKERVKSQKTSIIVLPKKIKKEHNSQVEFIFNQGDLPRNYVIIASQLLMSEWEVLFKTYPMYRMFFDQREPGLIRLLISFNTERTLLVKEKEEIVHQLLPKLEGILEAIDQPIKEKIDQIHSLTTDLEERKDMLLKLTTLKESQDQLLEKKSQLRLLSLQKKIADNEAQLNKLRQQTIKLNEHNQQLLATLTVSDIQIKELTNKISVSTEQLVEEQQIHSEQQMTLNNLLKEANNQRLTEKELFEEQLATSKSKLIDVTKQLSEEKKEHTQQLKELNNHLELITQKREEEQQLAKKKHNQLETKLNEITKQQAEEREQTGRKLVDLESSLVVSAKQLIKEKKEHETLVADLNNQLTTSIQQMAEEKAIDTKEIENLTIRLNSVTTQLEEEKSSRVDEVTHLNECLEAVSKQLEDVKLNEVNSVAKLEKRLEDAYKELEKEKKNYVETIETLEERLESVSLEHQKERSIHTQTVADLNNRLETSTQQLEDMKKAHTEKLADVDSLLEGSFKQFLQEKEIGKGIQTEATHSAETVKQLLTKHLYAKTLSPNIMPATSSWETLFATSQLKYQQLNNSTEMKSKEPVKPHRRLLPPTEEDIINKSETKQVSSNSMKALSTEELAIKEQFFSHDLGMLNHKVSLDVQTYRNYFNNASFLNFRWQKMLENPSISINPLFVETFSPYVAELDLFLEELLATVKTHLLNREKITIPKHSLNLLTAYNSLSDYLN